MSSFLGIFALGDTLNAVVLTKNGSFVPSNSTAVPTYAIYDAAVANNVMANGTGSGSFRHTGTITGAADNGAGLVRLTSASHGLTTSQRVTVTGVVGTTEANATTIVTSISSSTFDQQGSTFSSAYVSGGTFNVTGAYKISHALTAGDGYATGKTYLLLVTYAISGVTYTDAYNFLVV